ncbi:MAG: phage tail sheath C-terminal domain-containing protein [Saprospiraceae bacterium]|nr:phage tail sheath C-terminal domain-containing protein [Saprospiraceae bacterium]
MAKKYTTPGVYINEKNAFPNSAVPVATAVPAFVGYTEKALRNQKDLTNRPTRISSFGEYVLYFGGAPHTTYALEADSHVPAGYQLHVQSNHFLLYHSIRLFFANGGSDCYIVSIGNYNNDVIIDTNFNSKEENIFYKGISTLLKEKEPTLLVIPDAILLSPSSCARVQQWMLEHCQQMQSQFAILDVYMDMTGGKDEQKPNTPDIIQAFRDSIGINSLQWGAAYYPWLRTTIVQETELNYTNVDSESFPVLIELLEKEVKEQETKNFIKPELANAIRAAIKKIGTTTDDKEVLAIHQNLYAVSALYKSIIKTIQRKMNLLPPSGGVAGVYCMVDNNVGVFQSPANTSIISVVEPFVNLNNTEQEFLNVSIDGKSVNAIRSFPGKGVLIWGARTLDGNSQEWLYVNVRRTAIFIEQSVKSAIEAYVFEPNDANTWTNIRSLITNFLIGVWKMGALAGAKPENAFAVNIGLGTTMTSVDIMNGILRINVMVAIIRPAEFIVITLEQKMQGG